MPVNEYFLPATCFDESKQIGGSKEPLCFSVCFVLFCFSGSTLMKKNKIVG